MKWLGRLSVLAVVAVLLAGGVLAVQMLRSLPKLDGTVQLPGLNQPVSIGRISSMIAVFGLAPTNCFTNLPPWKIPRSGIEVTL